MHDNVGEPPVVELPAEVVPGHDLAITRSSGDQSRCAFTGPPGAGGSRWAGRGGVAAVVGEPPPLVTTEVVVAAPEEVVVEVGEVVVAAQGCAALKRPAGRDVAATAAIEIRATLWRLRRHVNGLSRRSQTSEPLPILRQPPTRARRSFPCDQGSLPRNSVTVLAPGADEPFKSWAVKRTRPRLHSIAKDSTSRTPSLMVERSSNIGRRTAKACRKTGGMGHSQTGVRWGYRDRASAIDLARFTDA